MMIETVHSCIVTGGAAARVGLDPLYALLRHQYPNARVRLTVGYHRLLSARVRLTVC